MRVVRGGGRELIVKVKDANAPSAVKFCPSGALTPSGSASPLCPSGTFFPSGNSHGYESFSGVVRRASELPEFAPVMFVPYGKVAAFWLPLTHWFKFPPTGSAFRPIRP